MFGFGKKQDLFDACFGYRPPRALPVSAAETEPSTPVVAVSQLPTYRHVWDHGEKFAGGLGPIDFLFTDYWALRARSRDLFQRNLYARGLIRRLVTNVINVGLHLEATPEEKILGKQEDELAEWSEDVENRFTVWGKNPYLCDFEERRTFGALQADAYREALLAGDVLVMLRQDPRTRLPRVQLISGELIQTPLGYQGSRREAKIVHGVELDSLGRHVAFWVRQEDGTSKRLPAYGEKSGRRIAWLLYGTDKRLDEVRGLPILALVLQGLKEIDRYRDATLRKAVVNSMMAMWIEKTTDKPGTLPITMGATRRGTETTVDGKGEPRRFSVAEQLPGSVVEELQTGEKPHAFQTQGTVEGFGVFEEAVIQSIAWANEIPPEILTLSFTNNYSASQAAINEFKLFLNPTRMKFGDDFCSPIYEDWLLAEVTQVDARIKAPGLLESFREIKQYDTYGAWISSDWSGNVKPAVDASKLTRGYTEQCEQGFITRDRASREISGTKFSKNVQKLRRENEQLAEALRPILEMEALLKASAQPLPPDAEDNKKPDDDDEQDSAA